MSALSLVSLVALGLTGPAQAATRQIQHPDGSITFLADPVQAPSPLTGADFAGEPPLRWVELVAEQHGVDIHVPRPVDLGFRAVDLRATDDLLPADSTWELLDAVLRTRGLTLAREGDVAEIVPAW
jgi:hypothetical protein